MKRIKALKGLKDKLNIFSLFNGKYNQKLISDIFNQRNRIDDPASIFVDPVQKLCSQNISKTFPVKLTFTDTFTDRDAYEYGTRMSDEIENIVARVKKTPLNVRDCILDDFIDAVYGSTLVMDNIHFTFHDSSVDLETNFSQDIKYESYSSVTNTSISDHQWVVYHTSLFLLETLYDNKFAESEMEIKQLDIMARVIFNNKYIVKIFFGSKKAYIFGPNVKDMAATICEKFLEAIATHDTLRNIVVNAMYHSLLLRSEPDIFDKYVEHAYFDSDKKTISRIRSDIKSADSYFTKSNMLYKFFDLIVDDIRQHPSMYSPMNSKLYKFEPIFSLLFGVMVNNSREIAAGMQYVIGKYNDTSVDNIKYIYMYMVYIYFQFIHDKGGKYIKFYLDGMDDIYTEILQNAIIHTYEALAFRAFGTSIEIMCAKFLAILLSLFDYNKFCLIMCGLLRNGNYSSASYDTNFVSRILNYILSINSNRINFEKMLVDDSIGKNSGEYPMYVVPVSLLHNIHTKNFQPTHSDTQIIGKDNAYMLIFQNDNYPTSFVYNGMYKYPMYTDSLSRCVGHKLFYGKAAITNAPNNKIIDHPIQHIIFDRVDGLEEESDKCKKYIMQLMHRREGDNDEWMRR